MCQPYCGRAERYFEPLRSTKKMPGTSEVLGLSLGGESGIVSDGVNWSAPMSEMPEFGVLALKTLGFFPMRPCQHP